MTREKVISKIKKLLELSNSNNEHEAAQAAAMAAELKLKHQIEEADISEEEFDEIDEPVEDHVIDEMGRTLHWKFEISNGLCKAFGCKAYYQNISYPRYGSRQKRESKFRVVGQRSNIDAIKYMYKYLTSEVERLTHKAYHEEVSECQKSYVSPPSARTWKRAFRLGAATVISHRLAEQRKKTFEKAKLEGKSNALVALDKQASAVKEYVKSLRLQRGSVPYYTSRSGFSAGAEAGRSIPLGSSKKIGSGSKQLKG